jgi:hypothetical protein
MMQAAMGRLARTNADARRKFRYMLAKAIYIEHVVKVLAGKSLSLQNLSLHVEHGGRSLPG